MNRDPIMGELYAAKEALAAKYNFDLHALAEAFRRSPSWTPVTRPARPIRTAQERLRRLTDPGDIIRELRKVKEQIAAASNYDIRKMADAARKLAQEHPLAEPGKSPKRLMPRDLASENGATRSAGSSRTARRKIQTPGAFRTLKGKAAK